MNQYSVSDIKEMTENKYYDRKSARIKPKDVVTHVILEIQELLEH